MSNRLLLDTNIVIAVFAGEAALVRKLQTAAEIFLPVIAVGELLYGALGSAKTRQNMERVRALAAQVTVLPCDFATTEQYAVIKQGLRQRGTPLPDNDVWIAAIAQQHRLTLVTRDEHFRQIDDLKYHKL